MSDKNTVLSLDQKSALRLISAAGVHGRVDNNAWTSGSALIRKGLVTKILMTGVTAQGRNQALYKLTNVGKDMVERIGQ